jgi:putative sterol carrier protein
MASATTEFFEGLEARGHDPRLEKLRATLRFDLANEKSTSRWLVAIDEGDIDVSHKNAKADCVVRSESRVFDAIARGEVNAFAAVLRGAVALEGNPEVMVIFQRVFPNPPSGKS